MSELRANLDVAVALVRLLVLNLDLAYYYLPRAWRGGYRSPWEEKT
ncbi:MAG: hypothetical protein WC314_08985 [Vulcanimicrobiota bacterium]